MTAKTWDLIVIGAGPGGYVAAARAAAGGLDTVLIERDSLLGGTCLLRGCIPTKALLQSARTLELCQKGAKTFGVMVSDADFSWEKVQKRRAMVVRKGVLGIKALMDKNGVTIVSGHGRLMGRGVVEIESEDGAKQTIQATSIILATGSTPSTIPGFEIDGERILSSAHLLEIASVPESLIVLGAGAVGVEFADLMSAFGARVTLVEVLPRILPIEDADASEVVTRAFKRRRIDVRTEARALSVTIAGQEVQVVLQEADDAQSETLTASHLLMATGRRARTGDLGLETVTAVVDRRGFIQVDPFGETATPGLYAIGDIVATPQLAHVASAEALNAVDHILGRDVKPLDPDLMPSCTYCHPEVASVGLTADEARARGYDVTVGRFDFAALGKASVLNEPHGFAKVVADRITGRPLGVHLVGAHATDLIAEACVALGAEIDLRDWSRIVHPHPTLSEAVAEAVADALGEGVHG